MTPIESIRRKVEGISESLDAILTELDNLEQPPPEPVEPPDDPLDPPEPGDEITDALVLRYSPANGKRLIGMCSAILPNVIVGAKHANILTGSEIELGSGERAVVLSKIKIIPPGWDGKEAIAAVLDREVSGWAPLYVHDSPIRFAEGASFSSIKIRATYAGIASGQSFDGARITEVEGTLRVSRRDGIRTATTYSADDPDIQYWGFSGNFEGKGGMSGGPCFVDDRIASVHWTVDGDDWIGCDQVFGMIEDNLPLVLNGWMRADYEDGLFAIEGGVQFARNSKRGYAMTYPCGPNARRSGETVKFSVLGGDDLKVRQLVQVKTPAGKRQKIQIVCVRSEKPAGTVMLKDGSTVTVSLGKEDIVHMRLPLSQILPGDEILSVLDLRLFTNAAITAVELI